MEANSLGEYLQENITVCIKEDKKAELEKKAESLGLVCEIARTNVLIAGYKAKIYQLKEYI